MSKNFNINLSLLSLFVCLNQYKYLVLLVFVQYTLTLLSPSGASGSVIQAPKRDPDVLIVTGSLMLVNFPHAANTHRITNPFLHL